MNTQPTNAALNSDVSSPLVNQLSDVRLPATHSTATSTLQIGSAALRASRTRDAAFAVSKTRPTPNVIDSAWAASGGSTPSTSQTSHSSATHEKHV